MSRKVDFWDNAVVESSFGTLKTELVYRTHWQWSLEPVDNGLSKIRCCFCYHSATNRARR